MVVGAAGLAGGGALALRPGAAGDQAERAGGRGRRHRYPALEDARDHAERRDRGGGGRALRRGAAGGDAGLRVRHAGLGAGAGGHAVRRRRHALGAGDRRRHPGSAGETLHAAARRRDPRHPGRGLRRSPSSWSSCWRRKACSGACATASFAASVPAPWRRRRRPRASRPLSSASSAPAARTPVLRVERPVEVLRRPARGGGRQLRRQRRRDPRHHRPERRRQDHAVQPAERRLPRTAARSLFGEQNLVGRKPHRICRLGVGRTFQVVRSFPRMPVLRQRRGRRLRRRPAGRREASPPRRAALARVGLLDRAGIVAGQPHQQAAAADGTGPRARRRPRCCCWTRRWPASAPRECDEVLDVLRAVCAPAA